MLIISQRWAKRDGLYIANTLILKVFYIVLVTILWLIYPFFGSEAKSGDYNLFVNT